MEYELTSKGTKDYNEIMNKIKPVTSKEIQERKQKATKQAIEGSKITRREAKQTLGVGKYATRSKEPSKPIDFVKEKKENDKMTEEYSKRFKKKKSGVLL